MAGHYAPLPSNGQYGIPDFGPLPPSANYGPASHSATQYAPLSPMPQQQEQLSPDIDDKKRSRVFSRSVSSFFSRSSFQGQKFTLKSRPKSHLWHIFGHVVAFAWMVPIVALLVLNLSNYIIGPSAWCPRGRCPANVWDANAVARANHLDNNDHNTLGALQLVSKALEVWFMFIATALIYDLAMILARKEGGLPIGFLLTHLQFTDIRNLFNPHLWTSAIPQRHAPSSQQKSAARLMIFGIFAAALTVLANLMGPAAAVLVLPSLKWLDTQHVPVQLFTGMDTSSPPTAGPVISDCSTENLTAGQYSCTASPYAASLDHFAASALMTEMQFTQNYSTPISSTSQESAVQFLVNTTESDGVAWAANRQVLQELSLDLFKLGHPEEYGKPATALNNSLQVILNRQGPSVGFNAFCNTGNTLVVDVADDKQIHCFSGWTIDNINNYTKCFRVGGGFSAENKHLTFNISTLDFDDPLNSTAVDVIFSDQATFFNSKTDFGSGITPCLNSEKAGSCDWDAIFTHPMPPDLQNMTHNIGLVSYSFSSFYGNLSTDGPQPDERARVFCDAASYIGFPDYSLDTLPSTNPTNLVRLNGLALKPAERDPIIVDPSWFLAAFSVDKNGVVPDRRPIAQELQKVLPLAWQSQANPNSYFWQTIQWLHLYALTQTMSIIPYSSRNLTSSPLTTTERASRPLTHDPNQPILHTWAARHVWAYGIGGSRTSKLGVVVVCLGLLCVLFRLLLGLTLGKREHSPVELFVAALEHHPTGEFEGKKQPKEMAKVRYVMEEDEADGKVRFVPESSYTGDFGRSSRTTTGLPGWEKIGTAFANGSRTFSWRNRTRSSTGTGEQQHSALNQGPVSGVNGVELTSSQNRPPSHFQERPPYMDPPAYPSVRAPSPAPSPAPPPLRGGYDIWG